MSQDKSLGDEVESYLRRQAEMKTAVNEVLARPENQQLIHQAAQKLLAEARAYLSGLDLDEETRRQLDEYYRTGDNWEQFWAGVFDYVRDHLTQSDQTQ